MNSGRSSRLSRDVQPGTSLASKNFSRNSHAQRNSILDRLTTTAGNKTGVEPTVSSTKPVSTDSPQKTNPALNNQLNLDAKIGRSLSRSRLDGSMSNFELLGENNSTMMEDGNQLWSRPSSRRGSETSRNTGMVQTSGDYQKASNYCERQKLNAWRRFSANINEYCERREHSARRVTLTKKDEPKSRLTTASHRESISGMPERHSQAISYISQNGQNDSESSDSGELVDLYAKSEISDNALPEIESLYNIVIEFTNNKYIARIKAHCLYHCSVPANDISIGHYGSFNAIEEANIQLREILRFHESIVIHPLSMFRSCWDLGNLLFLMIILFVLPMQIGGIMAPDSEPRYVKIINLVMDLWFIVDVYLNFRTCILRGKGERSICIPAEIRKVYFKSRWFAIDLVSSVPIDVLLRLFISDGVKNLGFIQNLKSVKIVRLIRVLKLLRIGRIIKNARVWERMNLVSHDVDFITHLLKMVLLLIMIIHVNACILYGVPYTIIEWYELSPPDYNFNIPNSNSTPALASDMTTMKDSWIVIRGLAQLSKSNISERWLWSLIKSVSHMICIGYGQFPPLNTHDIQATIFTTLIGQITFAIFLGLIITAMHQKQVTRVIYQQKQAELTDYMAFRKLPQTLRRSIQEYIEARYEGCVFNEDTIIKMLNPGLQKVVIETSKSWHLQSENCPIAYCSDEFIQECSDILKSETYLTNDIIIKPNAFVRNVTFIDKGFIGEYKNHIRIYNYMKGMGVFKELLSETVYQKCLYESVKESAKKQQEKMSEEAKNSSNNNPFGNIRFSEVVRSKIEKENIGKQGIGRDAKNQDSKDQDTKDQMLNNNNSDIQTSEIAEDAKTITFTDNQAQQEGSGISQSPYYTASSADADYIFRVDRLTYFVCETTVNVYELDLFKFMNIVKKYPADRDTILRWYDEHAG